MDFKSLFGNFVMQGLKVGAASVAAHNSGMNVDPNAMALMAYGILHEIHRAIKKAKPDWTWLP